MSRKSKDLTNNEFIALLSANMKRLREKFHLTQEELSFRSGLHRNYISDSERGTRNISLIAVGKIAKGFGVDINELFTK